MAILNRAYWVKKIYPVFDFQEPRVLLMWACAHGEAHTAPGRPHAHSRELGRPVQPPGSRARDGTDHFPRPATPLSCSRASGMFSLTRSWDTSLEKSLEGICPDERFLKIHHRQRFFSRGKRASYISGRMCRWDQLLHWIWVKTASPVACLETELSWLGIPFVNQIEKWAELIKGSLFFLSASAHLCLQTGQGENGRELLSLLWMGYWAPRRGQHWQRLGSQQVGRVCPLQGRWAFLQLWPVTGGMSQGGPAYAGSDGLTSGKREEGRGGCGCPILIPGPSPMEPAELLSGQEWRS